MPRPAAPGSKPSSILLNTLSFPVTACGPSSRGSRTASDPSSSRSPWSWNFQSRAAAEERSGLLSDYQDRDDDLGEDAISMLSNIAARSDGASAAQRRRARRIRAARGGASGWSDWIACCGPRRVGDASSDEEDSLRRRRQASRGVQEGHQSSSRSHPPPSRHRRSSSIDSYNSGGIKSDGEERHHQSYQGARSAGSQPSGLLAEVLQAGEEDAGSLGDETIMGRMADLTTTNQEQSSSRQERESGPKGAATTQQDDEPPTDHDAEQTIAAEADDKDTAVATEAIPVASSSGISEQTSSEVASAQEGARGDVDASIAAAKAARRAQRKLERQRLAELRSDSGSRPSRFMTEAEAEAAAGGFGLAGEEEETAADERRATRASRDEWSAHQYGQAEEEWHQQDSQYQYDPLNDQYSQGPPQQYHQEEEYGHFHEGEQYDPLQAQQEGSIIHHHYYYDDPHQQDFKGEQDDQQQQEYYHQQQDQPQIFVSPSALPPLPSPTKTEDASLRQIWRRKGHSSEDDEEEADDGDLAGLGGKSRKSKNRYNRRRGDYLDDGGSSTGARSEEGRRQLSVGEERISSSSSGRPPSASSGGSGSYADRRRRRRQEAEGEDSSSAPTSISAAAESSTTTKSRSKSYRSRRTALDGKTKTLAEQQEDDARADAAAGGF